MATFYLINTVTTADGVKHLPGSLLDDGTSVYTQVVAAGGEVEASSNALIAAAALKATNAHINKGMNEADMESTMRSALDASQSAQAAAHDTVDAATIVAQESFPDLQTAGTAIHAQVAGGAAVNVSSGFTMPLPRRTVQIVLGVGGVATNYTVTGTDITGAALVEVIAASAAGTFQGTRAFETITSLTSNIDPVGTTDLQTGVGFALARPFVALQALAVNGVVEAAASSHAATGTIVLTTAPNAARDYTARYTSTHTHALS